MKTDNSWFYPLIGVLVPAFVLLFGIFGLFKTQRLIDFYLRYYRGNEDLEALKKRSETKSYIYSVKASSIGMIIFGIAVLYNVIKQIMKNS